MIIKREEENIYGDTLLKISFYTVTTLVTIVITMVSFWMLHGKDLISRHEVNEIVAKQVIEIDNRFAERNKDQIRLEQVLNDNTRAIRLLEIQIATLTKTLDLMNQLEEKYSNGKSQTFQSTPIPVPSTNN